MTSSAPSTLASLLAEDCAPAVQTAAWLRRWKNNAYHIVASHYERCHALLACAKKKRMRMFELKHGKSEGNNLGLAMKTRSITGSMSDTSELFEESDDDCEVLEDTYEPTTTLPLRETNSEALAVAQMSAAGAALAEVESAARQRLEQEALCAARSFSEEISQSLADALSCTAQRRHQERLCEEESNEAVQRYKIEDEEDAEFGVLLEAMDMDFWMVAQVEAARRAEPIVPTKTLSVLSLAPIVKHISQNTEKAMQTTEYATREGTTQTEEVLLHDGDYEVLSERHNVSVNGTPDAGSRWRQLYLFSEATQTSEMVSEETIANQANCAIGVKEKDEEKTEVAARGSLFSIINRFEQSPPTREIILQGKEEISLSNVSKILTVSPESHELSVKRIITDNTVDSGGCDHQRSQTPAHESAQRSSLGGTHMGLAERASATKSESLRLQKSFTNDNGPGVDSSVCESEKFEIAFGDHFCLDSSHACRLLQLEKRNRRCLEQQELVEQNELRWHELNDYRTLTWLHACAVEAKDTASDYSIKSKKEVESDVSSVAAAPSVYHSSASLRAHLNSDGDDDGGGSGSGSGSSDKGNDMPSTDVPQPIATAERRLSIAWCVDMTSGVPRAPPRLTNRHRTAAVERHVLSGDRRQLSEKRQTSLLLVRGGDAKATPRRWIYAKKSGDDLLLRTPKHASATRRDKTLGYTEQFERRLLWQQRLKNASGFLTPDPSYCRATTSFLESAEWSYQKMYVENKLCMFHCRSRGQIGIRKCTDIVCNEVSRMQSIGNQGTVSAQCISMCTF